MCNWNMNHINIKEYFIKNISSLRIFLLLNQIICTNSFLGFTPISNLLTFVNISSILIMGVSTQTANTSLEVKNHQNEHTKMVDKMKTF